MSSRKVRKLICDFYTSLLNGEEFMKDREMSSNGFNKPGFGWTSTGRSVELVRGEDISNVGLSPNYIYEFIKSNLGVEVSDDIYDKIILSLKQTLGETEAEKAIFELQTHGTSNNRPLRYDIMKIRPNNAFPLHAHPNIEIVYVIYGSMHEYRYEGEALKTDYVDCIGPNMTTMNTTTSKFIHRVTRAATEDSTQSDNNSFLVNELGSIHMSYTEDDGAVILAIWSGRHANVPVSEYPVEGVLPPLPNNGEHILYCYSYLLHILVIFSSYVYVPFYLVVCIVKPVRPEDDHK